MTENKNTLKVTGINKSYGKNHILKDLDLSVEDKELLVLLGPSGCGKTTLLRIIAGLIETDTGNVFISDRNVTHEYAHKRDVGLVFQDYALFPHMTVAKNVAFGLRMQKKTKKDIRRRVTDCLRQVGMESFVNRKVTELSGGEQQRIALARALALQPRMLMLDEPLGALDHTLRQTLIEELRHVLGENGIPTIYVTHDQEEAFALADEIALLHDGSILQIGNPENLYHFPQSVWSANFLGLNNIIPAEVDDDGLVTIKIEDQQFSIPLFEKLKLCKGQRVDVLFQGGERSEEIWESNYTLRGKVKESVFRGSEFEIKLSIGESYEFSLRHIRPIPRGTVVFIRYTSEDLRLFPV